MLSLELRWKELVPEEEFQLVDASLNEISLSENIDPAGTDFIIGSAARWIDIKLINPIRLDAIEFNTISIDCRASKMTLYMDAIEVIERQATYYEEYYPNLYVERRTIEI